MSEQTDRAVRVLARVLGDGRISARTLATEMAISESQLGALRYGRQRFPVELAPDLYEAIAPVDPSLALWAYSEIVGLRLIGHEARPTTGTDSDPLTVDALQTSGALGEVGLAIAQAGEEVDHLEAAAMLPAVRRARREVGQLAEKIEARARRTPQLSLTSAEAR